VRSAVAWVLRNSDVVVADSRNVRDNAYRYYRYRGPIEVIPLGVRQPQVPRVARPELGLPEGAFVTITVGRLVKRKGIDSLLRALASPACRDVHLVIVGDGPEREALQRLSGELGLAGRVTFTGRVDETRKWQLLMCADAYVSATLHEGFGLVYLEGMAAGLPIVTFDHGGQVDFLRDGETGYLVAAGDVDGLARAVARLASDPERARRFRENNLRRAPEHRIEECARRYEEVFERVIAGRSSKRATEAPVPG
jgi:glycosyltransferase involved in cell wall biosynthesis